ncbi:MAG: GatB/YqeY domain-containing protein, partial [Candidatus Omnitrophota bacterium]|nr:GatB/YqeY domain-containing protein [Candidatus Omnitrophota bacterium]
MLEEKINNDIKEAMKSKNPVKVTALRMLKAAIKNVAIRKKIDLLEDADIFQIVAKQIKQRKDSIESFSRGKREDLVEKESREMEILQAYLPEQLPEQEVIAIVKEAIIEINAQSRSDMGKVMKIALEKVKGRADA